MKWKDCICTFFGVLGSIFVQAMGGMSYSLYTLLIFMLVDYVTGLLVAAVFKKSTKTRSGALSSSICWKGLCKKGMMLLIVLVANHLDVLLECVYIREAVVLAFVLSEAISLTENAGLMGVPIPKMITDAIDLLKKRSESR